ncbi:MAG: hypothetical protein JXA75_06740 [Candidatus Thermoplasmatota archaeon]|nr:hypothetical protein [Candidatus Thermoplasmatota archaeon]
MGLIDMIVEAATAAIIVIVSIFFSPSFIDIFYHDILYLSWFIYLPWQNDKANRQNQQEYPPKKSLLTFALFSINRREGKNT